MDALLECGATAALWEGEEVMAIPGAFHHGDRKKLRFAQHSK
jgi:hypothetical protein